MVLFEAVFNVFNPGKFYHDVSFFNTASVSSSAGIFWQIYKISPIAIGLSVSVYVCVSVCYNRVHRSYVPWRKSKM